MNKFEVHLFFYSPMETHEQNHFFNSLKLPSEYIVQKFHINKYSIYINFFVKIALHIW